MFSLHSSMHEAK